MKYPSLFRFAFLFLLVSPVIAKAQWVANGIPVSFAPNQQLYPVMISDNAGGAIIAWTDARGADFDVYAQRVSATGLTLWATNGVAVCTFAGDQGDVQMTSDGAGGAIITWTDGRNGDDDIYAQRVDASGVPQWTAGGVAVCHATDFQSTPLIAPDGSGGAVIAWNDNRNTTDYNLYVQRVNASGGMLYAANGVAACSAAQNQYLTALVPNGSGAVIAVWYDDRNGTDANIYAQRVNNIGGVSWAADGVALCAASGDQDLPVAVADGSGGAIVAWEDFRSGTDYDVYAQRVISSGVVQWTADGVGICTAAGDQSTPTITTDGGGGAIITWDDTRSGPDPDIYAQRITGPGVVQWTANGAAVCTATLRQEKPALTPDGSGGAIIVWSDRRNGNPDVYAQRVGSSGSAAWAADGIPVVNAGLQQNFPALTQVNGGGAMFAWQDFRADVKGDIYAVRLQSSGTVPTGVGGSTPPLSMTLSEGYPNPFSSSAVLDLTLAHDATVKADVFDAAGHRVRSIDLGRLREGPSRLTFDGRDDRARALPSGVYFYRVHAGSETTAKKMVIAR